MTAGTPFDEVADRVWVARYDRWDVNVCLVGGDDGLLMVDTHGSATDAGAVVDDIRRLGAGEVTRIVNTHAHVDHVLGNGTVRAAYGEIPVLAHETAAAELAGYADPLPDDGTAIVLPDQTFSSVLTLDLGDRVVELVHPGRGHTAGDLVVRVPDADVLLAGDLVEESAPPSYGSDSWPMDWPLSLDVVLSLITPASLVVPGHGAPVDRAFVEDQRNQLGIIAETVRDLAARGVPLDQALDAGEWPWERERLRDAVRRGYEQLPRSQKRLPLV